MRFSLSLLLPVLASATLQSFVQHHQVPVQDTLESEGFKVFTSQYSEHHSVRIKKVQNDTLCDAHSAQYTGWLDVGGKHLFFWYFDSQNDPAADPLALWLTGGPGGSSMLGMLMELGPCLINEHGNGTVHNDYGWTKNTNLLFVDSPAGVGFSYIDEGIPQPATSFTTAQDLHHFLQILVTDVFPSLGHGEGKELHITGESYGGHYVPALGAQIVSQNLLYPKRPQINLRSIFVGNAYVSPRDTAWGYWDTLCTLNPGVETPIFNQTRCDIMAANIPRCMDLAGICYEHPDFAICQAAESVCWHGVIKHYDGESGSAKPHRNRFDISKPCSSRDDLCYEEAKLINDYLNLPWVFEALAVPSAVKNYSIYSMDVEHAFDLANDQPITMQPQVLYLLESGIDVLFYQGNLDIACNTAGNLKWAESMLWRGQPAFVAHPKTAWKFEGEEVGWYKEVKVRTAGGGQTTFALSTVNGAGHMVPYDKPKQALALVDKWLNKRSFAEKS